MTNEQVELLDRCNYIEDGLTSWEMDFLDSLNDQRDRPLSEKQDQILRRIERQKGL